MFGKQNLIAADPKCRLESACNPQFVKHPSDHRLTEDPPGFRIRLQHAAENAVELPERFLKEDDVVEIARFDAALLQAKLNSICGKTEVVLDAGKALLFRGGNQLSIG